jgi:hypothetical protein
MSTNVRFYKPKKERRATGIGNSIRRRLSASDTFEMLARATNFHFPIRLLVALHANCSEWILKYCLARAANMRRGTADRCTLLRPMIIAAFDRLAFDRS